MPLPRIIIEQQPDGSFVVESYINGQRERTAVEQGEEIFHIRAALSRQARQIQARADHYRNSGVHAERKVGSPIPAGYVQAHATDVISSLVRVCHCGEIVRPFMERCADCPGTQGAGKVKQNPQVVQELSEKARHRRVWNDVRAFHGEAFANRTVGHLSPNSPKEAKLPPATIDML